MALLLLACALLLRIPAGFMPHANARGVAFGWCNAVSPEAAAEGKELLEKALADRPPPQQKPAPDQPCPFAAAAHASTGPAPAPLLQPVASDPPAYSATLRTIPGRGLAAPPPLSTGPPLLA